MKKSDILRAVFSYLISGATMVGYFFAFIIYLIGAIFNANEVIIEAVAIGVAAVSCYGGIALLCFIKQDLRKQYLLLFFSSIALSIAIPLLFFVFAQLIDVFTSQSEFNYLLILYGIIGFAFLAGSIVVLVYWVILTKRKRREQLALK